MNDNWEELKPKIQSLGERLLRSKWATTFTINETGIVFIPTPLGRRRVKQLWNIMRELEPQTLASFDKDFLFLLVLKEAERLGWK